MASETRRIAKALVERRIERFESRHPLDASKARLDAAISALDLGGATQFTPEWMVEQGKVRLDAQFAPSRRTHRRLQWTSIALTFLIAGSIWVVAAAREEEGAAAFLLPLFTALGILALPFVAVGLGSQREADEARIRRAIRRALVD
jgi:hypothetical protein